MAIILIIMLVLFLVLIGWMWNSLGSIEKKVKIICMIVGVGIVYLLTFVIFNISKIGIYYDDLTVMRVIRSVFVALFTIINGYVLLPNVFRKLEQINNDEIGKDKLIRAIVVLLIMVVLLILFESLYFGDVQRGIMQIIRK